MKQDVSYSTGKFDRTIGKSEKLLKWFAYEHLPQPMQEISKPFHDLALSIVFGIPCNAERTQCLRNLLAAKDCAVRSFLDDGQEKTLYLPEDIKPLGFPES